LVLSRLQYDNTRASLVAPRAAVVLDRKKLHRHQLDDRGRGGALTLGAFLDGWLAKAKANMESATYRSYASRRSGCTTSATLARPSCHRGDAPKLVREQLCHSWIRLTLDPFSLVVKASSAVSADHVDLLIRRERGAADGV